MTRKSFVRLQLRAETHLAHRNQSFEMGKVPISIETASFILNMLSPKLALQRMQKALTPEELAIWRQEEAIDYCRSLIAKVEDKISIDCDDNPDATLFLLKLNVIIEQEFNRVREQTKKTGEI